MVQNHIWTNAGWQPVKGESKESEWQSWTWTYESYVAKVLSKWISMSGVTF